MQTKRVLLIEDNPGDVRLIREMLSDDADTHFEVNHADRLESGLTSVQGHGISVILLDLALPDSFGQREVEQNDGNAVALDASQPAFQPVGMVDFKMRVGIVRKHFADEPNISRIVLDEQYSLRLHGAC